VQRCRDADGWSLQGELSTVNQSLERTSDLVGQRLHPGKHAGSGRDQQSDDGDRNQKMNGEMEADRRPRRRKIRRRGRVCV